jgi:hypothetical protein
VSRGIRLGRGRLEEAYSRERRLVFELVGGGVRFAVLFFIFEQMVDKAG